MSVGGESENQSMAPVRILALCKSADSIRSTITFLSRRGIQITPVYSMQEMLDKLGERLFDYVFLSVTYPHQKLETIPSLLIKTFNIESVYFAEKWDRRSEALMANLRAKHVIYGPLTGPSVLLKVRQLIKAATDERTKAAEKEAAAIAASERPIQPEEESGAMIIKSKSKSADDQQIILQSTHAKPEEIAELMKFLSEGSSESDTKMTFESSSPPDHKVFLQRGPVPKIIAHIPSGGMKDRGLAVFKKDPRAEQFEKKTFKNEVRSSPSIKMKVQQPAKVLPFPNSRGAPLKRVPVHISANPKVMVVWECARRAVLDVTQAAEVYDSAISRIHSLTLLSIDSKFIRGCFLLTAGKGKSYPQGAISDLQNRFLFHLLEGGQHVNPNECEVIDIDTDGLPDGAFIDSDFAITASSDVAELSISFLDIAPANPEIKRGALDDFSQIQVKDVATGVPLTFDAYIHMPLNNKTLKYLKEGGALGLKQKSKLIEDGTEHLYIKENSVDTFKEFHARASLQEVFGKRKDKKAA